MNFSLPSVRRFHQILSGLDRSQADSCCISESRQLRFEASIQTRSRCPAPSPSRDTFVKSPVAKFHKALVAKCLSNVERPHRLHDVALSMAEVLPVEIPPFSQVLLRDSNFTLLDEPPTPLNFSGKVLLMKLLPLSPTDNCFRP